MLHVGISGPIAAGKSTLARSLSLLVGKSLLHSETVSFATGIRELIEMEHHSGRVALMAMKIQSWGWDELKAHWAAIMIDSYMNEYPSVPGVKNRRLMQYIGTEVGRQTINEDIWILHTKQLLNAVPMLDYGFTDDVRFDNEADAVDVHIRISIPDYARQCYEERMQQFDSTYTYSNHASEHSLTSPALYTIPVCFVANDVKRLFDKLERIRRLR